MATGQKISAQTVATSFDGSDLATIVQSGVNKSITHDVFMDDTQILKAWVNLNGTGTVAIRDDFNVSSITDNGAGNYTVNFTNNLSDANYSGVVTVSGTTIGQSNFLATISDANPTASAFRFEVTQANTGTPTDVLFVSVQIFGS